MKHVILPALALLAACSTAPSSEYDIQSLEQKLGQRTIQEPEPQIPGFVSLFEQQPDGNGY